MMLLSRHLGMKLLFFLSLNLVTNTVVSLLSNIEKVLEQIVYKHLFNFLQTNNILTSLQSGFVPDDSTINQLTYLYNIFCQSLDAGKEIRVIFCDISKAFDRVWHKGLVIKLKPAGINGKLLKWFENYLSDRKQQVLISGVHSVWANIEAGVLQDSILSPLYSSFI